MEKEQLKPFIKQVLKDLIDCEAKGVVKFEIQLEGATISFNVTI